MIKRFFIVGNYVGSVPKGKNIEDYMIDQLEKDILSTPPNQMNKYLHSFFSVIESDEEIDIEDYENE